MRKISLACVILQAKLIHSHIVQGIRLTAEYFSVARHLAEHFVHCP